MFQPVEEHSILGVFLQINFKFSVYFLSDIFLYTIFNSA